MGSSQQKNGGVIKSGVQPENPVGNVQFGADPNKNQNELEKSVKKS